MSGRLIDEEVTFCICEKRYRSPYQPVPSASMGTEIANRRGGRGGEGGVPTLLSLLADHFPVAIHILNIKDRKSIRERQPNGLIRLHSST
jgi:hypothetical protein